MSLNERLQDVIACTCLAKQKPVPVDGRINCFPSGGRSAWMVIQRRDIALEQIHVHMLKEDCGLQIVKIFVSLQWAEAIFLIRADAWVCQLADPVLSHSHWQRATGPLPELIRPLDKSYVRPCWRKSGGSPSSLSHLNGCVQFTTCFTVL